MKKILFILVPFLLFANAGTYNFEIEQGETCVRVVTYTDANGDAYDITGWEVRMQIREWVEYAETILVISTTEGSITLSDPENGEFTITIPADSTAEMDFRRAYYDVECVKTDGKITRLLEGTVTLDKEVTR